MKKSHTFLTRVVRIMRDMKYSSIEWIGEIPKNWNVDKIKYHFSNNKIIVGNNADKYERLALTLNGVVKRPKDDNKGLQPEKFDSYQILKPNELVFKLIDLQNLSTSRIGLSPYLGLVSSSYIIISTKKSIVPSFAEKYFVSMWQRRIFNALGDSGVRSSLSANYLLNLSIVYPSIHKQQQIADFLDRKCSEIDALRLEIEKEIATLKEYKKSIITEAVTKGLNKNVPMKDSGIKYVGIIPKSWNIHPVYYYFVERKNKNTFGLETNLLSLSYGNIIHKDINTTGGLLPESFNTYNIVEPYDIIIRPTDLQNDKRSLRTGLVREHGIITSAYIALKASKKIHIPYFHYLLHAFDVMKVFYNMGNGVRQGLNFSEFSKLMVFEPPQNEQKQIADYLDRKCYKIDDIIEAKNKQLSTLDEYKKSLIYEYVTGKKEVPGV